MQEKQEIKNTLQELIGEKFILNELADSLRMPIEDLLDYLFELQEKEFIEFISFSDGTLRISRLGEEKAKGKFKKEKIFKFPKDRELSKLTIFSLSLPIELRIEFDKCMNDNDLVEKLKKMSENELIIFLKKRSEIFINENKEIIENQESEIRKLKTNKQELRNQDSKSKSLTAAERKEIEENYKSQFNLPKSVKKDIDFETEKEKKLETERRSNKSKTGFFETNQEKYQRVSNKLKRENQNKIKDFKKELEMRKKNVTSYRLGEIVSGKVKKIIDKGFYVDIGKSDGFVHITEIKSPRSLKFLKQMKVSNKLNFQIVDIDFNRGNIDLIPTSKNLSNRISSDKQSSEIAKHKILINETIEDIYNGNGKESLKFLVRLVKKTMKHNSSEWSLIPSNSKTKKIRLINSGIELCSVESAGLKLTVINQQNKDSNELQKLIDEFVPPRKKQGFFPVLMSAVPLFLPNEVAKKHKKLLYTAFLEIFELSIQTGKNPMKTSHSPYLLEILAEEFSDDLIQPSYIQ